MNTRLLAVNGSGGAFVSVSASLPCRRLEVIEDDATTAQGLDFQTPDDNFTATFRATQAHQPIVRGSSVANADGRGPLIGINAQVAGTQTSTATVMLKLRSATATGTNVRVVEYE